MVEQAIAPIVQEVGEYISSSVKSLVPASSQGNVNVNISTGKFEILAQMQHNSVAYEQEIDHS